MESIENIVCEIKQLNTEAVSLGGALLGEPNPPAEAALLKAAKVQDFPRSYRHFLSICNGWPRFWERLTLAGIRTDDASRMDEYFAASCKGQLEDLQALGEIRDEADLSAWKLELPRNVLLREMVPLGTNFVGAYLLLDKLRRGPDGEMAVLRWNLSYGAMEDGYFRNFHAYLIHVRDQVHARLLEMRNKAKKKK